MASKIIEYLGINLTKHLKRLYTEKYKKMMREIKDLNKKRNKPSSWIRRVNMSVLPKLIWTSFYMYLVYSHNNLVSVESGKVLGEILQTLISVIMVIVPGCTTQ